MTPQEELFAHLFNHEKLLVKDMDILTLRAHREELSKIAFEAKARIYAVDDEEKTRKKVSDSDKPTGFTRSVNTDETTSDAIRTIKERQKRLSKSEKVQVELKKLYEMVGSNSTDATKQTDKAMAAATILQNVKDKESKESVTNPMLRSPFSQDNGFVITSKRQNDISADNKPKIEESKPLLNPFEKK